MEMKRIATAKIYNKSNGESGFKLWSRLFPSLGFVTSSIWGVRSGG